MVANTRDGLAAARARGRKGGQPSKLTAEQVDASTTAASTPSPRSPACSG
ncbi:hypothetical protein [Rhodococcus sp. (in: high G+C Gram-positive bacteria)]|nr:hypothetical protein [Rhodococcus sp. (in: high G+C Gram-positive bacteria)]